MTRRICLTLPTNRYSVEMITLMGAEATYAVETFGVEVHLLILDSCADETFDAHAGAISALPLTAGVVVHHLNESMQRDFFQRAMDAGRVLDREVVMDLMLPDAVAYGACINRAFVIAAALGCESVHHRDSDCTYQETYGGLAFPIHHELTWLGETALDVATRVTQNSLPIEHQHKRVAVVGGSFIGEMSVDIEEIFTLDPEAFFEVVKMWSGPGLSEEDTRTLVADSFRGSRDTSFRTDRTELGLLDFHSRLDMCNSALTTLYEQVPLPPATETIGSDYFLLHVVRQTPLPAVIHNRNIMNYYTRERKTGDGFIAYQFRYVKFLLSMLYLHRIYAAMGELGEALVDAGGRVDRRSLITIVRESTSVDSSPNLEKLDRIDSIYRGLGGQYQDFANALQPERERLMSEAVRDIEQFADLMEAWGPLILGAKLTPLYLSTQVPA